MTKAMQELAHILYSQLLNDTPVLSGNMKNHIRIANVSDHEITYVIDPPFYNVSVWKKTGNIYYRNIGYFKRNGKWYKKKLNGKKYGVISYANWVNEIGAFGTRNKSMHWVNRSCYSACTSLPNSEVNNELEL